ncbi:MAG: winged helix-turn-helix domain-containing protein, partial [Chloroflexi bacterium]|nr:winged helix-turn-helix domain-containing protein [Chloroflexota bacterium]
MADISLAEARRIALTEQGFGRPRPASADRAALAGTLDRMGLVQLDSVNVVA